MIASEVQSEILSIDRSVIRECYLDSPALFCFVLCFFFAASLQPVKNGWKGFGMGDRDAGFRSGLLRKQWGECCALLARQ